MTLGMKLRILRAQRTLKDVANAIDYSVSALSDLERDRTLPSLDTCQRLADYYGVSLATLFADVRISPGVYHDEYPRQGDKEPQP